MIQDREIKPESRVLVTITNKYGGTERYTGKVIEWLPSGLLKVESDQGGSKQKTRNVSANNVKLIKQP